MSKFVTALSAIAQQTRLDVLTLLCCDVCNGETSGDLALQIGVPANTMSTHLGVLQHAGLVSAQRTGRHVVYAADRTAVARLLTTLSAQLKPDVRHGSDGTDFYGWMAAFQGDAGMGVEGGPREAQPWSRRAYIARPGAGRGDRRTP